MSTAERVAGEQIQGSICYHLLSFTILYYDYLLTLSDERRFFWVSSSNSKLKWIRGGIGRGGPGNGSNNSNGGGGGGNRRTWGSSLFLVTRYLSIFGNVPVALQNFRVWNPESCNDFQTYHQAFSVVVQSLVAILLTMRVYALHQCSRKVLVGLLFAGASVIIVGCWSFATKSGTDEKEAGIDVSRWIGCNPMISDVSGRRFAAAWGSLLAFDTLIFTLTLYKAIVVSRGGEVHLVKLLMRDGTMYFGVLSAANLSNILSFLLADPLLKGVSTSFANVISVTLVARLMINLKKSTHRRFLLHTSRTSQHHHYRSRPHYLKSTDMGVSGSLGLGTDTSMSVGAMGVGSVSTWEAAVGTGSGTSSGYGVDGDVGDFGDLGVSAIYGGDEDGEGLGYELDFDDEYGDDGEVGEEVGNSELELGIGGGVGTEGGSGLEEQGERAGVEEKGKGHATSLAV